MGWHTRRWVELSCQSQCGKISDHPRFCQVLHYLPGIKSIKIIMIGPAMNNKNQTETTQTLEMDVCPSCLRDGRKREHIIHPCVSHHLFCGRSRISRCPCFFFGTVSPTRTIAPLTLVLRTLRWRSTAVFTTLTFMMPGLRLCSCS